MSVVRLKGLSTTQLLNVKSVQSIRGHSNVGVVVNVRSRDGMIRARALMSVEIFVIEVALHLGPVQVGHRTVIVWNLVETVKAKANRGVTIRTHNARVLVAVLNLREIVRRGAARLIEEIARGTIPEIDSRHTV